MALQCKQGGNRSEILKLRRVFCHLKINSRCYFSLFGWDGLITEVNERSSNLVLVCQALRCKKQLEDLAVWAEGVIPWVSLAIFQL